eukprot:2901192-Rhodomonas_salina.3
MNLNASAALPSAGDWQPQTVGPSVRAPAQWLLPGYLFLLPVTPRLLLPKMRHHFEITPPNSAEPEPGWAATKCHPDWKQ